MLKLAARVLLDAIIGLALAGAALAVGIPLMIHQQLIVPGDRLGAVVITVVLVSAVGGMLFRPGSALNRYERK